MQAYLSRLCYPYEGVNLSSLCAWAPELGDVSRGLSAWRLPCVCHLQSAVCSAFGLGYTHPGGDRRPQGLSLNNSVVLNPVLRWSGF